MRRRARLLRLLAHLSSVWLTLFLMLAPVTLPCSMEHGQAGSGHEAHAMASHGGHADHDVPPTPRETCDCAQSCCTLPGVTVPTVAMSVETVVVEPAVLVLPHPPRVQAQSRTRLLPFAHAPPV